MLNALAHTKPFYLFVGRKKQRLTKPVRFEARNELIDAGFEIPVHTVVSSTFKLFIDEELFASVTVYPHRKYRRAPIRLKKTKRGLLEFHLVKKYVTLH